MQTHAADAPAAPVCYVSAAVWNLAQLNIEQRRRERRDNPLVFQRYAETLLRSLDHPATYDSASGEAT